MIRCKHVNKRPLLIGLSKLYTHKHSSRRLHLTLRLSVPGAWFPEHRKSQEVDVLQVFSLGTHLLLTPGRKLLRPDFVIFQTFVVLSHTVRWIQGT